MNIRKEQWCIWWNASGKQKTVERCTKPISIPKKSEALAEFVGIMIGDGGIAPFHIDVTLDAETDKDYAQYVVRLMSRLFRVSPKIYYRKDSRAVGLSIARKDLVQYCNSLGLVTGNKFNNGLEIPQWILENSTYYRACVRGMVDTDGSFFTHRYSVNEKEYTYLKIDFTSKSVPLLTQVQDILQKEGICVKLSATRSCIRVESKEGVQRYIEIFGTRNPKNQKKIKSFGAVVERLNTHLC